MAVGPVEYVIIAFPGNKFSGEIVPEIARLVENDIVRIIDVVFVRKEADGSVEAVEFDAHDDVLEYGFADVDGEAGGLLNDEDIEMATEALEPNSSAAIIVWEHRWAAGVAQAIRNADGEIIAGERIPAPYVEAAMAGLENG